MNLRLLKAATSLAVNSNHSPFFRLSAPEARNTGSGRQIFEANAATLPEGVTRFGHSAQELGMVL